MRIIAPTAAPVANSAVDMRERLTRTLTTAEMLLLTSYLGDLKTQMELAAETGCPQTTISFRIRRAARKLTAAGFPIVALPGKGRRRSRMAVRYVDAEALGRLLVTRDGDGTRRGRWIDAKKVI